MPVTTINDFTADQITQLEFKKGLRGQNTNDLLNGTKYAIVLLQLDAAVTPGDYAGIKADFVALSEIDDVFLLIDHQTRATVPANHTQVARIITDIELRDDS